MLEHGGVDTFLAPYRTLMAAANEAATATAAAQACTPSEELMVAVAGAQLTDSKDKEGAAVSRWVWMCVCVCQCVSGWLLCAQSCSTSHSSFAVGPESNDSLTLLNSTFLYLYILLTLLSVHHLYTRVIL